MNNKKGFTLIELLIVIAIIGILASIVVVSLGDQSGEASEKKAQFNVASLARVIEARRIDVDNDTEAEICAGAEGIGGVAGGSADVGKLYCKYSPTSEDFIVFEVYKDTVATSKLDIFCADKDSPTPKKKTGVDDGDVTIADDSCADLDA